MQSTYIQHQEQSITILKAYTRYIIAAGGQHSANDTSYQVPDTYWPPCLHPTGVTLQTFKNRALAKNARKKKGKEKTKEKVARRFRLRRSKNRSASSWPVLSPSWPWWSYLTLGLPLQAHLLLSCGLLGHLLLQHRHVLVEHPLAEDKTAALETII